MNKTELCKHLLNKGVLLHNRNGQLETGCEGKRLFHGKVREKNIVLHDVGSVTRESLLIKRNLIVEKDRSADSRLVDQFNTIGQDIQQRGLAGTRGTHNIRGLAWRCVASSSLNDLLAAVSLASSNDLLFALLNLNLEADVVPAELDWVLA